MGPHIYVDWQYAWNVILRQMWVLSSNVSVVCQIQALILDKQNYEMEKMILLVYSQTDYHAFENL